jgi:hypothetical protein
MLEEIARRAVSGVAWGLAMTLVLRVTQSRDGITALRPLAKTAIKGAVIATEKLREVATEARETLEDIYAETRADQNNGDEAYTPQLTTEEEAIAVEMEPDGGEQQRYG